MTMTQAGRSRWGIGMIVSDDDDVVGSDARGMRMMRHPLLIALAALALVMAHRLVRAQETHEPGPQDHLTLAVYTPNTPFKSGSLRYAYASQLARHIGADVGVNIKPQSFTKMVDLEVAIKKKAVSFAVLDGVYLATRGAPYSVLAVSTTGGEPAPMWALFSASAKALGELKGQPLFVAQSGPRDHDFLELLFSGELDVRRFFSRTLATPDMSSALMAVQSRREGAVFAIESLGAGLQRVFEAGRVPNPAFCVVDASLPAALTARVQSALLKFRSEPPLEAWQAGDGAAYLALRSGISGRGKKPLMVKARTVQLDPGDPLQLQAPEPLLPVAARHWALAE